MIGQLRRSLLAVVFLLGVGSCAASAAEVYTVDLREAEASQRLEVISLQGLLARQPEGPQVVAISREADLAAVGLLLGPEQKPSPLSADELIDKFKADLPGQVIYDPDQPFTIGIATTLAGIHGTLLTARDLGLPTLEDLRGRFADRLQAYRWAAGALPERCAAGKVAVIGDDIAGPRDWAIRERAFVCDLDATIADERELLLRVLAASPINTPVLGWPAARAGTLGLSNLISALAGRGDYLVPCGDVGNLSIMGGGGQPPRGQRIRYLEPSDRPVVTFVMLGGERIDYDLGAMRGLWADPARSGLALGWTLSPSLLDYAHAAAVGYYVGARFGGDELVMSPNGPGLTWFSQQATLTKYLASVETAAKTANMTALVMSDTAGADVLKQLAGVTALEGAFALTGSQIPSGLYDRLPVVAEAVRANNIEQTIKDIRAQVEARQRFIMVGVEAGAMPPRDVAAVIEGLGDLVVVAHPTEFLRLFRVGAAMAQAGVKELQKTTEIEIGEIAFSRPDAEGPDDAWPTLVSAVIKSPEPVLLAEAVYVTDRDPVPFAVTLRPQADAEGGRYQGSIPATLRGGKVGVKIRVVDSKLRVAWSPVETFEVAMVDADGDGLSDTEEALLGSDPAKPDTDGDGLLDANDARPRVPDQWVNYYLDPVLPPSDQPFLQDDQGSSVGEDFREAATEGGSWIYRLPLSGVPRGAPAAVAVVAEGVVVSMSSDGKEWTEIHRPKPEDKSADLLIRDLPAEWVPGPAVFLRFERAAAEAGQPARVYEASIVSPPEAPSVLMPLPTPPFPVVGIATRMSAKVYSPDGIAEVQLHYQVNGGKVETLEMTEVEHSQVYAVDLPELKNADLLVYWVAGKDKQDRVATSARAAVPVGVTRAETISLVAGADFEGDWSPAGAYEGAARSGSAGAVDQASVFELAQRGMYNVWLLAAPRGGRIAVEVDGDRVGEIKPGADDGWTLLGQVGLVRGGEHRVRVIETSAGDQPGVRATYAEVLLTADGRLKPPDDLVLPYRNTFTIIYPADHETVKGTVIIRATAAGNVNYVGCYVGANRVPLGNQRTPPYSWRWRTVAVPNGDYVIRFHVMNRRDKDIFIPGIDRTARVEN